ncbi:MAG: ABC transporter ATP-binding protein [Deltaproteobacteria bacterium]|nr:ABC transporter ATP-binding protein [Deltaproteobacteria bacterium]
MVLKVQNLSKKFAQHGATVSALSDVSFELPAGASLGVTGESGAGKSTLLNLLGGLEKPSAGQITFNDRDLLRMTDQEEAKFRQQDLGFIFQFHQLLEDFSVLENVMMPLLIGGTPRQQAEETAQIWLDKVGIAHTAKRFPKEVSGGEQQRAAIARGLIHRPCLVLADEPTGNLDEGNADHVFELLCDLNHDLGATLVMVTHHADFAKRLTHHMVLRDGQIKNWQTNLK